MHKGSPLAIIFMMIEQIREILHQQPFQPFVITMTNGDRYEVHNPDLVAIGRRHVFFFAYPDSDRMAWLRMNQIVAVETLEPAA